MKTLYFFSEDIDFQLPSSQLLHPWIEEVITEKGGKVAALGFIFCSDDYLLDINKRHLGHDTLTDIITFDYTDGGEELEGEAYISIETVRANAHQLKKPFYEELCRVIIHGVLHLLGYDDKEHATQTAMRNEEDRCLSMATCQAYLAERAKRIDPGETHLPPVHATYADEG